MQRLREIHDELLLSVAKARGRLAKRGLTTFFPMRGSAATGELMVIGRAVRGWQKSPWTADDAVDSERRAKIIQEVVDRSSTKDRCPMQWVNDAWGCPRKKGYNTHTSAFWRVIRSVSESIVGVGENWPSKLIWSDLYKVAPFKCGNPWARLIYAQIDACKRHLAEEVALWKPKRVLFLTGWDWAEQFIGYLGRPVGERRDGYVQWSGKIELAFAQPVKTVVSVHPGCVRGKWVRKSGRHARLIGGLEMRLPWLAPR
jgi:hypothetical protein